MEHTDNNEVTLELEEENAAASDAAEDTSEISASENDDADDSRENRTAKISRLLSLIFLVGFLVCAIVICVKLWTGHTEQKGYDALVEIVQPAAGIPAASPAPGEEAPAAQPVEIKNLDQLKQMNNDFFAWISIPDTAINYPVVFTPDAPDYYLRRDFKGNYASAGVPFLGKDCTANGNSFIVHGHNMKNGTMFADLMNYQSAEYCTAHPFVQFDTPEAKGTYEVIAAFPYDATDRPDLTFRLYDYAGKLDGEHFNEYLQQVKQASLYDTGITASYGDTLLTLSTCTNGAKMDRFIVVARKAA